MDGSPSLHTRTAIVTGAGQGMGACINTASFDFTGGDLMV